MPLQTSGAISLNDIHVEAGGGSGTTASINDADIRDLIGKGSGVTMSFSEWYGASAFNFTNTLVRTINDPNTYGLPSGDAIGDPAVGVAGNYIAVTAWQEDSAAATSSGVVHIFNRSTGALLHTINNPNSGGGSASDRFANSMKMDDTKVIIGAYTEQSGNLSFAGKAYIFSLATGSLLHTLNNPSTYSTEQGDRFGYSVDIDGDYAIVGAYREGPSYTGAAYIFNTSTGALVHTLTNPSAGANEYFGTNVAIHGNYAAVAAPNYDGGGYADVGRVYVYNVSSGALVYTLENPNAYNTPAFDLFGNPDTGGMSMSSRYLAVSAIYEDDAGGTTSGAGYVFDLTNGSLVQTFTNPNAYGTSANDQFGYSCAVDGDHVVFGARYEDNASGSKGGVAYLFNIPSGQSVATIVNPNAYSTPTSDQFGTSVDIDGDTIVIGAPGEDEVNFSSSGKVYVFE